MRALVSSVLPGLVLVILAIGAAQGAELPAPERLPRTNLMVFRGEDNRLKPVLTTNDWLRRRGEILKGMEKIMGPMGAMYRGPLEPETIEEKDMGEYRQRLITYVSEPGSRVPAYLLIPKGASANDRRGAVLVLHSTDQEYGPRVTVEQVRTNYRAFARELAQRGFVVIAPAYPHQGSYAPDLKALGYRSGTIKAIRDNARAIDLVEKMVEVKSGGVAALGHSLGGHNAIYTAVWEPRIKAVVSSCGFDSFSAYQKGDIRGWTSERYMPALLEYQSKLGEVPFDFHELLGALAPRRVFINAPLQDSNFNSESVDEVVSSAIAIYRLHGVEGNLKVAHPDCGHDFPSRERETAYELIETVLGKPAVPSRMSDTKKDG